MKRMSIRRYLTLSLIALGALPVALFALVFWTALAAHLNEETRALTRAMLRTASAELKSRALEGPRRTLPTILLLSAGETNPDRIRATLRDIIAPSPEYLMLAVLDEDGNAIAAYPEMNFRSGSAYPMRSKSTATGVTTFSPPFYAAVLDRVVVEASYGNEKRTAIALLDLEWLSARLFLAAGSSEDRLGMVWLNGTYIASSDPSRMRAGEAIDVSLLSGATTRYVESGVEYLVTSEPIAGSEWKAVYFRSSRKALEPLNELSLRLAVLLFLAVAISAVMAYLAWKRISSPLVSLIMKIDTISQGNYNERVGLDLAPEYRDIAMAMNAMAESIERRKQELENSERRYRLMFEKTGVPALLISSGDGAIRDANPTAIDYYGYPLEVLRERVVIELDAGMATVADYTSESSLSTRHRLHSGEVRDVIAFSSPMDMNGEAQRYVLVIDVTERRMAEERTEKALAEKTMLLREVYHRVKNNLQIVSSLLSMQTESAADGDVASALQSTRDRVFAMSLAHELVYQMPDISSVAIDDYSYQVLAYLADAYAAPRSCLETLFAPIRMEMERAIPFGLLLNEIASNAFKYGLGGDSEPSVRATLSLEESTASSNVMLVIEDDGPGFPDSATEKSLGLQIAQGLAAQLKGTAVWGKSPRGGTRVVVEFPLSGRAGFD